jgi:hypothetical protein
VYRIGWAEKNSPQKQNYQSRTFSSAQIHVSFLSKQVRFLVSEATLRGLFSSFGEVLDVAIKKSQFEQVCLMLELPIF